MAHSKLLETRASRLNSNSSSESSNSSENLPLAVAMTDRGEKSEIALFIPRNYNSDSMQIEDERMKSHIHQRGQCPGLRSYTLDNSTCSGCESCKFNKKVT